MRQLFFIITLFVCRSLTSQTVVQVLPEVFNQFPNVRDFSLSKNSNELYFTVESYKKEYSFIAFTKKENNKWSKPEVASFSGMYKDLEPFLSPDGLKLFFASNRIDNSSEKTKSDIDIWYVERTDLNKPWSSPKKISEIVNTSADEFFPSVTEKGDLFFTAAYGNSKGKEDIYVSRYINGEYTTPTSLPREVNSEKYEFNAFVAPDESFIIFTSYGRKDAQGGGDLYICKKDKNNNWLPAVNLGDVINSEKIEYCPFFNFSTNELFFTSEKTSIQKSFSSQKNIHELLTIMNTNPNGLSRIYKTTFTISDY